MGPSEAERYMALAVKEGRKAISECGDNPPVGCILVKDGAVVGRGHTNIPGKPHAEAMAISQLRNFEGVVAFVTLEPCSFNGRTPSCAKALIDVGIKTVYVGIVDPDPRNNGKGIEKLREAGIDVRIGILKEEIKVDLGDYLGKAP